MAITLYHISEHHYPDGHHLGTYDLFHYNKENQVNTIIDQGSPYKSVHRGRCLIGFESLAHCDYYANNLKLKTPDIHFYFYKIEVLQCIKSPFAVIECLNTKIIEEQTCKEAIEEYWKPKLPWHIYEYLFQKAVVLEEVHCLSDVDDIVETQLKCFEDVGNLLAFVH